MSITPGYTDDEIRAYVYEYERQPWGTKDAWRRAQGFTHHRIRRWRQAVFDGDLALGLIPREGVLMTDSTDRRRVASQHARGEIESEQLRARIRELEATNEALGKAIGLLHQLNEQGSDTSETNEPKSS